VELAQQAEVGLLLFWGDAAGAADERQWVGAADVEADAGVLGAEVAGAVRPGAAAAVAGGAAEHAVLRQVGVEGAQAVGHPRADGRVGALADVPAGVPLQLGAVVVVGRPQRADDGDVVGAGACVLPPVADGEAGLAVLLVAGIEAHEDAAAAVG